MKKPTKKTKPKTSLRQMLTTLSPRKDAKEAFNKLLNRAAKNK